MFLIAKSDMCLQVTKEGHVVTDVRVSGGNEKKVVGSKSWSEKQGESGNRKVESLFQKQKCLPSRENEEWYSHTTLSMYLNGVTKSSGKNGLFMYITIRNEHRDRKGYLENGGIESKENFWKREVMCFHTDVIDSIGKKFLLILEKWSSA